MTGYVPRTTALGGTGARAVTIALMSAALAWGGSASTSTAAPAPTAASAGAVSLPTTGHTGTRVRVTEKEFSIALDRTRFRPGKYTFVIQNKGRHPHDLVISGPGIRSKASRVIGGGRYGSLTVTLRKGTYLLWCSVAGHKVAGMHTTIRVR